MGKNKGSLTLLPVNCLNSDWVQCRRTCQKSKVRHRDHFKTRKKCKLRVEWVGSDRVWKIPLFFNPSLSISCFVFQSWLASLTRIFSPATTLSSSSLTLPHTFLPSVITAVSDRIVPEQQNSPILTTATAAGLVWCTPPCTASTRPWLQLRISMIPVHMWNIVNTSLSSIPWYQYSLLLCCCLFTVSTLCLCVSWYQDIKLISRYPNDNTKSYWISLLRQHLIINVNFNCITTQKFTDILPILLLFENRTQITKFFLLA